MAVYIAYTIIQLQDMILSFHWQVRRHTQRKRFPIENDKDDKKSHIEIDNDDKNLILSKSYVSDASKQNFRLDNKMNVDMINKSGQNLELKDLRSELLGIVETRV